jgi:Rod binding domain-containing protein
MNVNATSAMRVLGKEKTSPSSLLGNERAVGPGAVERLRQTTGKVVGSVFFGTLLKTMRESKLNGTIGHGGRGEEVFSAQLHGILAEKMGESQQNGVADALFRHLRKQQSLISDARPGIAGEGL